MDLSIIIPFCNERESLPPLLEELAAAIGNVDLEVEVILVDDGSDDESFETAREEAKRAGLPNLSLIKLRKNFGKGPALQAAMDRARGELLFTLDGDGQDDPSLLPSFLNKLKEGFDMVVGWRKKRRDPWGKVVASKIYNGLLSGLMGFRFRDINSGMRLFRSSCLREIDFYGDQYRLLPALFFSQGFRVCQLEVAHRPRVKGRTKYGKSRFITGLLDIWTLLFLLRFPFRPAHFFGPLGLALLAGGGAINLYIAYLRLYYGTIGFRYPLLILGVMMVVVGLQFIFTGFLAELIAFYLHKSRKAYSVEKFEREDSKG